VISKAIKGMGRDLWCGCWKVENITTTRDIGEMGNLMGMVSTFQKHRSTGVNSKQAYGVVKALKSPTDIFMRVNLPMECVKVTDFFTRKM